MVQTTLGIDGMQCEMCEAHVNEAIRKAFPEIKEVRSSHRKKTTRILSNEVIDEAALRSVIAATGYEFLSYKLHIRIKYDGFGMLAQKTFHDGSTEVWVWDGLALIRRGSDIYVNEPHISGGVPILSKTDEGVRYHEHDFPGTTLWSTDTKGNLVKDYQDTTIFGEGSIQKDRSARFTGKPYDEDLQAYVFPYRNYDEKSARWRSADPAGYPDGLNQHFYAAVPTLEIDTMGLEIIIYGDITITPSDGSMYTIENQPTSFNASLKIKFTGEDKILAKNGKFGFGLTLDSINIVSVNPRIITEETTFLDAAINIAYEGNRALDIGDHILSAFIENRITGGKSDLITSKFSIEK